MLKPMMIDNFIGSKREKFGNWHIAKPEQYDSIFQRLYHAYLVLIGEAMAVQFYEDIYKWRSLSKIKDENEPMI